MDYSLFHDMYFSGEKEDFMKILKLFWEYTRNKNLHISNVEVFCGKFFKVSSRTTEATLGGIIDRCEPSTVEVFGEKVVVPPSLSISFFEELERDDSSQALKIFHDIIKIAPKVRFDGATWNFDGDTETKQFDISYQDGELTMKNLYLSNQELAQHYVSEFSKRIPFETFKDIFKLEEDVDEDGTMYGKFISEHIFPDNQLSEMSREIFNEFWGYGFCKITDEENFQKALEEYRKLPIPTVKEVKDSVLNLTPEDYKSTFEETDDDSGFVEVNLDDLTVENSMEAKDLLQEIFEENFLTVKTPKGLKS